ncbi:SARP family transcriptional regulator [Deinococcus cellulosilyticus NBRC 106333 = KACC 11606]|uniref:SARP family transcriptional regulator n=2 Tax=Deinococcus cellulosilyticus TaxID=401558 RepID=A0A511MVS8_DEIC1|nr:SARP family transcriptional regulator [Deinococcus cellulosilyticus NBRC 106333 = KACC 11606]
MPEKTLSRKKVRSVFKMLALHPSHRLQKESLIDQLWADLEPEQGAAQLYNALYNLRKAFQPYGGVEVGLNRGEIVLSAEGGVRVDALDFEKNTLTALKSRAFEQLLGALNLWTGDFSPEDLYDDWSEPYRNRFGELRLQLLLVFADEALRAGQVERAQQAYSNVLEVFPASEGAHVGLMRLAVLLGNKEGLSRQYERYTAATFEELGEGPAPQVQALYQQLRAELEKSVVVVPQPTLTELPGRKMELQHLQGLFAEGARLISIVAMGGQGKTRLAQVFAEQCGIPHILIPAHQSSNVAALLDRLRLELQAGEEQVPVLDVLAARGQVLLVLDNTEQVEGLENWISQALGRAPGLRLLCTSRRPLNLPGEHLLELSGLRPEDAIRLFCELARKTDPDFVCTETDQNLIREISEQVGGSPLALELATGWVRLMTLPEILSEVRDNVAFLDQGPQKSLSQVLNSTWDRLTPFEQDSLKALSTFAGGFTVLQARNTFQIRPQVLLSLSQLGLVQKNGALLGLHPLIRQLALAHLEKNSPHLEVHARHHLDLLRRNHSILNGSERAAYSTALEHNRQIMPDVLLAMKYSLHHRPAGFSEACPAFTEACMFSFLMSEGVALLKEATNHPDPQVRSVSLLCLGEVHVWQGDLAAGLNCLKACDLQLLNPALQALWYRHHGLIAERQGQFEASLEDLRRGLEVAPTEDAIALLHLQMGDAYAAKSMFPEASEAYRKAGLLTITQNNPRFYATLIMRLGTLAGRTEQWGPAEERFLKAIAAFRELQDTGNLNRAVNNLSLVYLSTGRYSEAKEQIQSSLLRARLFHSPGTLTALLNNLGVACLAIGDLKTALESVQESLKICRDSGFTRRIPSCLLHLGDIHLAAREFELARMAFEEAHNLFQGWNPLGQLDNLCGAAWIATELQDFTTARTLLEEGRELVQRHPSRRVRFLATQAFLLSRSGQSFDAQKTLLEALQACRNPSDELSVGWLMPSMKVLPDDTLTRQLAARVAGSSRTHWLHHQWAQAHGVQAVQGDLLVWAKDASAALARALEGFTSE